MGQQSRSAGAQRSRITSGPIWSAHTVGPSYPIAPKRRRSHRQTWTEDIPMHGKPEPCIPRLNHPHPGQVALCQQAAETQHMEKSGSTQNPTSTRGRGIYQSSSTLPTLRGEASRLTPQTHGEGDMVPRPPPDIHAQHKGTPEVWPVCRGVPLKPSGPYHNLQTHITDVTIHVHRVIEAG